MSDQDPFQRGQEESEALRRQLEALREDVRAVVRDEVERAGMPRRELDRLVADAVRAEVAEAKASSPAWQSAGLVAVGAVVGVLAGAFGYGALAGSGGEGPAEPVDPAATEPPPAEVAVQDDTAQALSSPSPEERAALYDSLFAARSDRLAPLVAAVEAAGAAPVLEAAALWSSGAPLDPLQHRRLHDAMVQAALNEVNGSALTLDGLLTRDPCGGSSCGALLALWESRGQELGMPGLPAEAASATDLLAVVERILILTRVEASGG